MDVSQLRLLSDKLQNRVIKMLGGGQEIGLCSGTPTSKQCCHSKDYALLNDSQIKAELCTYCMSGHISGPWILQNWWNSQEGCCTLVLCFNQMAA